MTNLGVSSYGLLSAVHPYPLFHLPIGSQGASCPCDGEERFSFSWPFASCSFFLALIEDQHRRGDYCGPEAALIAYCGLGDVGGADDFIGEAIDLFFLVPGAVGVELHVERGGQHFGG